MTDKEQAFGAIYDSKVDEESALMKSVEKFKKDPIVPLGMLGFFGMVGYGVYHFKNRGNMSASVYLMHLRVKAQSMVVGAMTLAVAYSLAKSLMTSKKEETVPR